MIGCLMIEFKLVYLDSHLIGILLAEKEQLDALNFYVGIVHRLSFSAKLSDHNRGRIEERRN